MNRSGGLVLAFGLTGLAFFLGCADGDKVDPQAYLAGNMPATKDAGAPVVETNPSKKVVKPIKDDKGTPPAGDDDDDDEIGGSTSSSSTSSGGSSSSSGGSSSSSSSSSSTSSSGGSSSSSSSSSSSGSTTPPPPPGPASCAGGQICTTQSGSTDAGYVAGDTGADVKTLSGYKSSWIKITVGEDSLGSNDLKLRATLTSPPGTNYDLFIHADSCNTPTAKSEKPAGADDTAGVVIPDLWGGADDQWVLVEVRHIGTDECDPAAKWTLKLEGNK